VRSCATTHRGKDSDYFVKEHICFDISDAVLPTNPIHTIKPSLEAKI